MPRSALRVHSPAGPPPAPALLRHFLRGLRGKPASRPRSPVGPADVRRLEAILNGARPGLDEAELAGRIVRVVLRAAGDVPLRAVAEAADASKAAQPRWDRDAGELQWHGVLVKRFRQDAANQFTVLDAFERQGWPASIDNPLPRRAGVDPKARRRDTVAGLNDGLAFGTIRFSTRGPGGRIRWAEYP